MFMGIGLGTRDVWLMGWKKVGPRMVEFYVNIFGVRNDGFGFNLP